MFPTFYLLSLSVVTLTHGPEFTSKCGLIVRFQRELLNVLHKVFNIQNGLERPKRVLARWMLNCMVRQVTASPASGLLRSKQISAFALAHLTALSIIA